MLKNDLLAGVCVGSLVIGTSLVSSGWSASIGILSAIGDIVINSWINVANHKYVGPEDVFTYSLLTTFNYVTAALIFHQLGSILRSLFKYLYSYIKNINYVHRMKIQDDYEAYIRLEEIVDSDSDTDFGVINKYSLKESDIEIESDIKPSLRKLSNNELETIFNEANSLPKSTIEDTLGRSEVKYTRSGPLETDTSITKFIKMDYMPDAIVTEKDCKVFEIVKNLIKKCKKGVLKQFSMSVNEHGQITLKNFRFKEVVD